MVQNSNQGIFSCDIDDLSSDGLMAQMAETDEVVSSSRLASELDLHSNAIQGERLSKFPGRWILALVLGAAFLSGVVITYAVSILTRNSGTMEAAAQNDASANASATTSATNPSTITVDVHGDVLHPGIYRLAVDARVVDAISAAGGYRNKDDSEFVNQAEPLVDGEEIVVPSLHTAKAATESVPPGDANSEPSHPTEIKVDLNTADETTLETIPGIGPKRASAIIAFRSAHGPFKSVSDLAKVRGFGNATISRLQQYVFVPSDTK